MFDRVGAANELRRLAFAHFWPMDEGTGTTCADLIGGRTATSNGAITWGASSWPRALAADTPTNQTGSGFNLSSATAGSAAFTTMGFVKYDQLANLPIILGYSGAGGNNFLMFYASSTTAFGFQPAAGGGQTTFTVPTLVTGRWYHLAVTRDTSNTMRCYVDGVESSTGGQSRSSDFSFDLIGRYYTGAVGTYGPNNIDGMLACWAHAARALNPVEIRRARRVCLDVLGATYRRRRA